MSDELDINKLVVESSFHVLENTYDAFKGSLQKYFHRNKLALNSGFKSYLDAVVPRVRQVATVLSEQPEDLLKLYVPVKFKSRGTPIGEPVLRREIERSHQGVVVGVAGCGKTLFLRSPSGAARSFAAKARRPRTGAEHAGETQGCGQVFVWRTSLSLIVTVAT